MNAEIVIQKLKSIGYQIRVDGPDILLTAEHDPPAELATTLLAELKGCKAEEVRLLNTAWPAEVKTLLDWFTTAPTEKAPFQLSACVRVLNADLFYAALRRDIEAGPCGPRARTGAIHGDLRDLGKLQ